MFGRLSFPVSGMINDEWSSDDVDMFRTAHQEWICKCLDGLMDDEALSPGRIAGEELQQASAGLQRGNRCLEDTPV